jgi:hypothetical protein
VTHDHEPDAVTVALHMVASSLMIVGYLCLATFAVQELWGFAAPLWGGPPLPTKTALAVALVGCGLLQRFHGTL